MTGVIQKFFQRMFDKMHEEKLPLFHDVSARNENALYTYKRGLATSSIAGKNLYSSGFLLPIKMTPLRREKCSLTA